MYSETLTILAAITEAFFPAFMTSCLSPVTVNAEARGLDNLITISLGGDFFNLSSAH